MQLKHRLSLLAISCLTACGGGGGGSSTLAVLSPYVRDQVPFATPTLVATVDPMDTKTTANYRSLGQTIRTTSSGALDLLITGQAENNDIQSKNEKWPSSQMQLFTWQNNVLVDRTQQWFPNNSGLLPGNAVTVTGDFNNRNRDDIFVMVSDDANHFSQAYVYTNTGTQFNRTSISMPSIITHDTKTYDMNRDGFIDIAVTDYGMNTSFLINNGAGGFDVKTPRSYLLTSTSSIAFGDFMNNNTTSMVATDPGGPGRNARLYSWDFLNNQVQLGDISTLPTSRFMLPQWASYRFGDGQGASHDVRAVSFDFDRDGKTDVLIFSRPWLTQGQWPRFSEIQFLRNLGAGQFQDVTDQVLVGYNTNTNVTYNPRLLDFNNDGLVDILVSSGDPTSAGSHQFLLATSDGKYVAAHQKVLTDFVTQVRNMASAGTAPQGEITLVKGPNNRLYLATYIMPLNADDRNISVYLSELGENNVVMTAQSSLDMIRQAWPYLSAASQNQTLARTSMNDGYGNSIIDVNKILQPVGSLGISFQGRLAARQPILGSLIAPGLDSNRFNNIAAVDDLGRHFMVNLSSMTRASNITSNISTVRMSANNQTWSARFLGDHIPQFQGLSVAGDGNFHTIGTSIYLDSKQTTSLQASHTRMPYSPWMSLSGVFGSIIETNTLDFAVTHKWNEMLASQVGLMQTTTLLRPGLVSSVDHISAGYIRTNYRSNGWNLYGGIQPTILRGNINLQVPASVDQHGNMHYTTTTVKLKNSIVGFAGIEYNYKQFRTNLVANQLNQRQIWFSYNQSW